MQGQAVSAFVAAANPQNNQNTYIKSTSRASEIMLLHYIQNIAFERTVHCTLVRYHDSNTAKWHDTRDVLTA